ncbi:MAG: TonB-dependent receptor [Vicinamibacterales bacterium]
MLALHAGALVAGAQPAHAGRLEGRVVDATALPLPGVLVELDGDAAQATARTDGVGRYTFEGVSPGAYRLRFSFPGFVTVIRRGVDVPAGHVTAPDAVLDVAASASVVVSGTRTFRSLAAVTGRDELLGVADAASTGIITPAELTGRAARRPADTLESVPGLAVSQHSGEGKATQYYLRGFNIDHGTDLSLSVAGMPVNLPTHGHGQGYADMNFLIPELVSGVQYRKGPAAADGGDFSAAGRVKVHYLNVLDRSLVRIEGGSYGHGRVLAAASPALGAGRLLVAAESMHDDGPWQRPDAMRRWNGVVRYSRGSALNGLAVTALAYDARWQSTDQIPRRAVEDGRLSRFGLVDGTDGGTTHRAGAVAEWQRTTVAGLTHLTAYAFDSGLDLFSNFTYFLDDPEHGDQFEQRDERWVAGATASRAWAATVLGRRSFVTIGADARHDAIGAVGLYRTRARRRLGTIREDAVGQSSLAGYVEVQTRWSDVVRTTAGLRGDVYRWRVRAGDPVNGGARAAGIANPSLAVAWSPWRQTEVYASAGGGFHSNDGRGATIRRDPVSGDPVPAVDPLVRARGAEVGLRSLAVPRLHTTLALWTLGLDSELVFVGDAGTTAASRPSRRVGLEWDADYHLTSWLRAEASAAYSRARFVDRAPEGQAVPGAIEGVASVGVALAPAGPWSAGLRWRYFGPRPLDEGGRVRSAPSNLVNAEAGVNVGRRWRLQVEAFNLLDSTSSDVDYYYRSRLPGEPAAGVDGVHFHPVEPRSLRVALVAAF